ncbi:MBL fold metallo-hydrolase [Streptosporangium lutulentum]
MILTNFGHACVRVQDGDRMLVIDPGTFSEAEAALSGATAVLVSHEHADHIDVEALKAALAGNPTLTVHTHAALAAELGEERSRSPRARPSPPRLHREGRRWRTRRGHRRPARLPESRVPRGWPLPSGGFLLRALRRGRHPAGSGVRALGEDR